MQKRPWSLYLLTVIAIGAYVRIFWGIDVTDEAYYVADAMLPWIGGKFFVNELFIQQTAAILFSPIVGLYHAVVPDNTGIILFVRHLYFAMTLATGFHLYHEWRMKYDKATALAGFALVLAFVPLSIPSLSYNTISFCILINLFLLGEALLEGRRGPRAVIAGALAAIGCFAYATFIVPVGLFGLLLGYRLYKVDRRAVYQGVMSFGVLSVGFLLLLSLLGWSQIRHAYEFSRHFTITDSQYAWEVAKEDFADGFPFWGVTLIPFAFLFLVPKKYRMAVFTVVIAGALATHVGFYWERFFDIGGLIRRSHLLLVFLGLSLLVGTLAQWSTLRSRIAFVPTAIAFLAILVYGRTSSNSFLNSAIPATALLLWLAVAWTSLRLRVGFLFTIAAAVLMFGYAGLYRELSITRLNTMVTSGPFAGLMTGARRASLLEEIHGDLNQFTAARSVFFFDHFPAGYLMSDRRPAGATLFTTRPPFGLGGRPMLTDYYAVTGDLPDLVFHFRMFEYDDRGLEALSFPTNRFGDPLHDFFRTHPGYQLVKQTDYYDIYIRKP